MAAKLVGASKIIAIDLRDDRLKLAGELGITHTINPSRSRLKSVGGNRWKRSRFYARDHGAYANSAAGD